MKTQHTNAERPWHVHIEGEKVGVLTHSNVDHLATFYGFHKEANAHLFASAPALLAALNNLQANPNDPRAHRQALDAIALVQPNQTKPNNNNNK